MQASFAAHLPAAPRRVERACAARRPRGTPSSARRARRDCRATSRATSTTCTASARPSATGSPPRSTEADIGSAIYYQPPLHLQPALRYLGYSEGDFPETEKAARENLCLPLWAGISGEQQAEVVSVAEARLESRPVLMRFPVNRHRVWQLAFDAVLIVAAWRLTFFLRFDQATPRLLPALARLAGRRARRRDQAGDVRRLRLLQPLVALRLHARHVGRRARRHGRARCSPTSCSTRSRPCTPRGCRAASPRSTSCCCSPSSPARVCSRAR